MTVGTCEFHDTTLFGRRCAAFLISFGAQRITYGGKTMGVPTQTHDHGRQSLIDRRRRGNETHKVNQLLLAMVKNKQATNLAINHSIPN